MGLFGKNKKGKVQRMEQYRVFMNASGKKADGPQETVLITEESEFMAVRVAEKQFPRLKVYWIEKAGSEE